MGSEVEEDEVYQEEKDRHVRHKGKKELNQSRPLCRQVIESRIRKSRKMGMAERDQTKM